MLWVLAFAVRAARLHAALGAAALVVASSKMASTSVGLPKTIDL